MENISESMPFKKDRLRERYVKLLRIACLLLLVQNFLLLIPIFNIWIFLSIFNIWFPIDLIGFLLLAVGYILYSTRESDNKIFYFAGGVCILGWVICKITYQYILPYTFDRRVWTIGLGRFLLAITDGGQVFGFYFGYEPFIPPYTQYMAFSFILGGMMLGIASIFIYFAHKGKTGIYFMVYGVVNLVIVFISFYPYVLHTDKFLSVNALTLMPFLKITLVPLLGAIAFNKLRNIEIK